jgi:hypothetical protein
VAHLGAFDPADGRRPRSLGGDASLAREVARRLLALPERSLFPENYDALTGDALRDRAYTWTASVYQILGHEYP